MSKPIPRVELAQDAKPYDTLDMAMRALAGGVPSGKDSGEQAGMVYRGHDGKYYPSTLAPQTDHDAFQLRAAIPNGYTLAGIFHNHPGTDSLAGMFSPQDVDVANNMKLPSYIRFMSDDSLKRYVPGTTHTAPMQVDGWRRQISYGDELDPAPASNTTNAATTAGTTN